jgi:hypothetical protein
MIVSKNVSPRAFTVINNAREHTKNKLIFVLDFLIFFSLHNVEHGDTIG